MGAVLLSGLRGAGIDVRVGFGGDGFGLCVAVVAGVGRGLVSASLCVSVEDEQPKTRIARPPMNSGTAMREDRVGIDLRLCLER